MAANRALRLACAVVVGVAAGAAMGLALDDVEPHVDVSVRRELRTEGYDMWIVRVTVRGGETLDELGVEPSCGPVHVITMPVRSVRSGVTAVFRVQLNDGRTSQGAVRVVQSGRVARTYETPLVEPF